MKDNQFPNITSDQYVPQDDDMLITIAKEELDLAEILNIQGEVIQQAVGTFPGGTRATSISQLLEVNTTVEEIIDEAANAETLLLCDMEAIIGITFPSNSAIIVNVATIVVNENNLIPLDTNRVINGTDISHSAGSTDVSLAANHIYEIIYSANAIPILPTTTEICTALLLDGIEIFNSNDCSILVQDSGSVSAQVTITTGTNIQILQIINQTIGGATFTALAPNLSNVCLRIVEIDTS